MLNAQGLHTVNRIDWMEIACSNASGEMYTGMHGQIGTDEVQTHAQIKKRHEQRKNRRVEAKSSRRNERQRSENENIPSTTE
ncbi:hypothetical protein Scep_014878 [Stephania cephalantha]|uniref:Uncharacterized protein n=1 Tax=Stephania cephalantha TaxID=152367 RepID=A0AAP0J477_9MAGN